VQHTVFYLLFELFKARRPQGIICQQLLDSRPEIHKGILKKDLFRHGMPPDRINRGFVHQRQRTERDRFVMPETTQPPPAIETVILLRAIMRQYSSNGNPG
jgi:hypothetical protein